MDALQKNETSELVDLPSGKKPVGCKWVFAVKFKGDGFLEWYKARLVAKWYTQTYGVDYQETFALAAKMNTVRVLLSLAVNFDWELQQYDVFFISKKQYIDQKIRSRTKQLLRIQGIYWQPRNKRRKGEKPHHPLPRGHQFQKI